ncbi:MAG: dihydrodipicolinate reductase, partial [bacterium]
MTSSAKETGSSRPLRIVQWATGSIGRYAIGAIAEDPGLELAGVWVHSATKHGIDAGTLAGIEKLGVAATT